MSTSSVRRWVGRLGLGMVIASLLATTSCGGDDDEPDGSNPKLSGFAGQKPQTILDAAEADMREVQSVRIDGPVSSLDIDGELHVQASATGDCQGTIVVDGGTVEIVATDGHVWVRPDEVVWGQIDPENAEAIISAVGHKWVSDMETTFASFCSLDSLVDELFQDVDGREPQVLPADPVQGHDVVKVRAQATNGQMFWYVRVDGKHYVDVFEGLGIDKGKLEFTDYDADVDVQPPAAEDIYAGATQAS